MSTPRVAPSDSPRLLRGFSLRLTPRRVVRLAKPGLLGLELPQHLSRMLLPRGVICLRLRGVRESKSPKRPLSSLLKTSGALGNRRSSEPMWTLMAHILANTASGSSHALLTSPINLTSRALPADFKTVADPRRSLPTWAISQLPPDLCDDVLRQIGALSARHANSPRLGLLPSKCSERLQPGEPVAPTRRSRRVSRGERAIRRKQG